MSCHDSSSPQLTTHPWRTRGSTCPEKINSWRLWFCCRPPTPKSRRTDCHRLMGNDGKWWDVTHLRSSLMIIDHLCRNKKEGAWVKSSEDGQNQKPGLDILHSRRHLSVHSIGTKIRLPLSCVLYFSLGRNKTLVEIDPKFLRPDLLGRWSSHCRGPPPEGSASSSFGWMPRLWPQPAGDEQHSVGR